MAPRVAALLLDWATGCALGLILAVVAWLRWLAASDGGTRQPSDAAIYAGLGILTASVPLWAIGSVVFLALWGQTPGLAAFALRVVGDDGVPPPPLRALLRVLALGLFGSAAALTPLIVVGAAAAAAQHTLPLLVGVIAAIPAALGIAEVACSAVRRDGRALHDVVSGTRVVRSGTVSAKGV